MRKPRPTFEEFVKANEGKIRAVVKRRLHWAPNDAEDAYQEILLQLWKAWPKIDWSKGNPGGLCMTVAWNISVTYGRWLFRIIKGKVLVDEVGLHIDEQDWSFRESTFMTRERESEPPKPRPWVETMYPEDRGLVDLAVAIARSGRMKGKSPGYKFHMEQWLPSSWDAKKVIYHWQHRMDNFRAAWENGKPIIWEDEPRNTRSHERERLLEWTRHWLPGVIRNVLDTSKQPPLRREHARQELIEWRNRCWAIGPNDCRGHKVQAEMTVPGWVFSGKDDYKACLWFRMNWNNYKSSIEEFGWGTWDDVRRLKNTARSMAWQKANADKVKARLDDPEVRRKRRETSRNWNRAHRRACLLARKRWVEKRKSDGFPVS